MNSLRVVLVTRRYWPLVGGAESATVNLARALRHLGAAPTILTGRHDAQWPADVVHREIPVHRLPCPRGRWGTLRYLIAVSRWLQRNRPDIDLVCVSRLAHEARTAVGALAGSGVPVVIRAESDETFEWTDPAQTGWTAASRTLRRCRQAQAVVATTDAVERRVVELGIERHRVLRINNGVKLLSSPRSPGLRTASRQALAAVNEDLRVPANQPVALCLGQMRPDNAWETVIRAWKHVAADWPYARLWLVGDGPHREVLYRRIRDADLVGRVWMPGEFDSTDDLMLAADLLVVPTLQPRESLAVLEAMAARLPVVVSAESGHLSLVTDGETGRVFPGRNATALAAAISRCFHHPMQADALAAAALQCVRATHSLSTMAKAHLQLFQHLVSTSARIAS
jgi:glycosyltransferase involved in cell wall biosynthesis